MQSMERRDLDAVDVRQRALVPIDRIVIGERHRKDMGDLAALADSIKAIGLLHPIVVTSDNRLIAGERRLNAVGVLGWTEVPVHVVDLEAIIFGEHAENEVRKDFTPSERVAIGLEVEAELARRHAKRRDTAIAFHVMGAVPDQATLNKVVNLPPLKPGQKGRDLAAERAGFSTGTYRNAKTVVDRGAPELVEKMDRGEVSISAAATIAKAPVERQAEIVALEPAERQEELRRIRDEAEQVRAAAREQEATTGPTAYTGFLKKHGRLPTPDEAATLAKVDGRETPDSTGKRHSPLRPSTKEERAAQKRRDACADQLWRTRQALMLLAMNDDDPAEVIEHATSIDRDIIGPHLAKGSTWLTRFTKEWKRHGK